MSKLVRILFVMALVAVVAVGTVAITKGKGGGGGGGCPNRHLVCPALWAPVICDDGKTYSNQCYADRVCATGCEPTGEGGPFPL